MSLGRSMCNCSGGCVKNALCDYSPEKNPYESSSGIDLNPFERFEAFTPDLDTNPIQTYYKKSVNENSINSNCQEKPKVTDDLYNELKMYKKVAVPVVVPVAVPIKSQLSLNKIEELTTVNSTPISSRENSICSSNINSKHIIAIVVVILIVFIFLNRKNKKIQ
jgi:hypothetical protein